MRSPGRQPLSFWNWSQAHLVLLLSQEGIEEILGKIWAEIGLAKSNRESEIMKPMDFICLSRDILGRDNTGTSLLLNFGIWFWFVCLYTLRVENALPFQIWLPPRTIYIHTPTETKRETIFSGHWSETPRKTKGKWVCNRHMDQIFIF